MRHPFFLIGWLISLALGASSCEVAQELMPDRGIGEEFGGPLDPLPAVPGELNSFGVDAEGNVYLTLEGSFSAFVWMKRSSSWEIISETQLADDAVPRRKRVTFTPDGTCYLGVSYDGDTPYAEAKDRYRFLRLEDGEVRPHMDLTLNEVAEISLDFTRLNLEGDLFPVGQDEGGQWVYFDKQRDAFFPIAGTSPDQTRSVFVHDDRYYLITTGNRILAIDPEAANVAEVFPGLYTSGDLNFVHDRMAYDGSVYALTNGGTSLLVWPTGESMPRIFTLSGAAGRTNLQIYPLRDGRIYATAWERQNSLCDEEIFELRSSGSLVYELHSVRTLPESSDKCFYLASFQLQDNRFYLPMISPTLNRSRVYRLDP